MHIYGGRDAPCCLYGILSSNLSYRIATCTYCVESPRAQIPNACTMSSRVTSRIRAKNGQFSSKTNHMIRCCSKCNSTETSQWRTGTDGSLLCNKCGIRLWRRNRNAKAARNEKRDQISSTPSTRFGNSTDGSSSSFASFAGIIRQREIKPPISSTRVKTEHKPLPPISSLLKSSEIKPPPRRNVCSLHSLLNPN